MDDGRTFGIIYLALVSLSYKASGSLWVIFFNLVWLNMKRTKINTKTVSSTFPDYRQIELSNRRGRENFLWIKRACFLIFLVEGKLNFELKLSWTHRVLNEKIDFQTTSSDGFKSSFVSKLFPENNGRKQFSKTPAPEVNTSSLKRDTQTFYFDKDRRENCEYRGMDTCC